MSREQHIRRWRSSRWQPRAPFDREQLLTAQAAALQLGVNPRTAQLRARRALVAGTSAVRCIAGAYVAPESWWVKSLIEQPIRLSYDGRVSPRICGST
jgi:hypothetical protein